MKDNSPTVKIKSLKDLNEIYLRKEIFDQIWPYERLKLDIAKLDELSDPPIVKIAAFLFKAQLVEHELKNLIDYLDEILEHETSTLPFTKIRSKKSAKYLKENYGLGQLKNELENYKSRAIRKIITKIDLFKKQRDKFTHRLYHETSDISDLAKQSQINQRDAIECLELINKAKNEILLRVALLKIDKLSKKNEK